MTKRYEAQVKAWRFWFIVILLSLAAFGLFLRMLQLTVFDRQFLQQQGNARTLRTVSIPATRGMITDRNGTPLAISSPVESVWVNPQQFDVKNQQDLDALAKLLHDTPKTLKTRLKKNSQREFVYLKRHVEPAVAEKVMASQIPGIYLKREYQRFYPEGEVTAHVLGFTNIDDQGQEGMELAYDQWLRGAPGKERVLKDRLGRVVAIEDIIKPEQPGHKLVLSIDHRLQYLAYRELQRVVKQSKAKSGSIVILDVQTGEVLAMVNQPAFNPNKQHRHSGSRYRNRAVTDVFEPGSTIKAFSVVNALQSGHYGADSIVDTSPGKIMVHGHEVSDGHRNNGRITVTQILQRSSNIGVSKLTLSLAPNSLWKTLHNFGFGQRTHSGFPGEVTGSLVEHDPWDPFVLATLSFGYGMSVTPLQLAQAYAILATGGVKHPVSLIKLDKSPSSQRVISEHVAHSVLAMLGTVTKKGGTATRARIPGYSVAGKTGTVRIVGEHGYEKDRHIGIFVGVAPASEPRIVTAVVVNDPRAGGFYGGLVAAPLFAKVTGGALRMLDVPPDDLKSKQS